MLGRMELDWVEPGQLRPLTRAEYEKLGELGFFDDERVELIFGVVVRMSDPGPAHEEAVAKCLQLLVPPLAGRAQVRCASPFAASDHSLPKPDLFVVPLGSYAAERPARALLIVEVSDSRLSFDRNAKARLYAATEVPEYWLVNLPDRSLEVRDLPVDGSYTRTRTFRAGETVAPAAFPDIQISVDAILP